ncbi:MAG: ABC transporter permease [Peptococcaceae bacterium]|nr:ABC transporter permease [Peptococcaceae bacterium]
MQKSLLKSSLREIKSSFGRFLAIVAIVALGVGFFAGLLVSEGAMLETGDRYLRQQGYFDFRLLSTLGFEEDDVKALAADSHVAHAEGAYRLDAYVSDGGDGEMVARFHSITDDVNKLALKAGRLPKKSGEIVADGSFYDESDIGKTLTLTDDNDKETLEGFEPHALTIVGIADSPLNMRIGRISTELGSGQVSALFYAPAEDFTADYYSEIYLTVPNTGQIYSDEYDAAVDEAEPAITALAEKRVDARYDDIASEVKAGQKKAQAAVDQASQAVKQAEAMGADAATIAKAKEGQKKAQAALDGITMPEEPEVYVLGRDTDAGYQFFKNDAAIVSAVAKVFPIFFFMVAALVCVTTMTRMMNEQRTQIGVLKSMGYSRASIMKKYLLYSGSSGILGCLIGFFVGTWGFPTVIWTAYSIYYAFPDKVLYVFSPTLMAISLVVSLLCTMGVTWLCGRSELRKTAANLIRPKAPKAGKRNPLERITPLWSRLTFLQKITVRNLFRYKVRFFMMLLGIGGCTALIVTGLALQDNFAGVADVQYSQIDLYDATATFTKPVDADDRAELDAVYDDNVDHVLYAYSGTMDISANGTTHSIAVHAPEGDDLSEYFSWHADGEDFSLPDDDEVLLDRGIADRLGVGAGDEVTLTDSEHREATLTVSGVYDNYVSNNLYMNRATLEKDFDKNDINSAYLIFADGVNQHEAAAEIMADSHVSNVSVVSDSLSMFADMLDSLDMIVFVIILCAGALAFIVLYNLTNINISERIREIATLKVLGFYPKETNVYVFRENTALTIIGALFGLFLGKLLHAFVMSQIVVDGLQFDAVVTGENYAVAFVLTMVFAFITQLIMKRKIAHIHMAESLKSVE